MTSSVATHLRHDAAELAGVVARVRDLIGLAEIRSGRWFHILAENYLRERDAKRIHESFDKLSDDERSLKSKTLIRRACALLSLTGACSGAAFTTASVTAAESGGLAGLIGFPLAGLVAGSEMMFRTLVHLRLSADLADLYGIHLGPDGSESLLRLYALALKLEDLCEAEESGRDLVDRVVKMEAEQVGQNIGKQLGDETLLRNLVPFLGIGIAAAANVRLTVRLGRFVRDHFALRRAFHGPFADLKRRSPASVQALIQGVWDMFLVEGRLSEHQAILLSELVATRAGADGQLAVDAFVPQRGDWIKQLKKHHADPKTRALLLHLLEMAAAVGGEVSEAEAKLVHKAADELHQPFDPAVLDNMARAFASGRLSPFRVH